MAFVYSLRAAIDVPRERRAGLLGGKAASLAVMTELGLAVPPAFVISTEACLAFLEQGTLPQGLEGEIAAGLAELEQAVGRRLGDPERPLLLSVRSGAPVSMPGMMDTVLNLGLNRATAVGLGRLIGDEDFAADSHRRFLESFGTIVMGVEAEAFAVEAGAGQDLVEAYEHVIRSRGGRPVPEDPREQLLQAVAAVFRSWNSPRAQTYRELERIPDDLGTAVTVQAMVFGNLDETSGTGVAFTRDPNTGEPGCYGDFLFRAQGEDVVSGRHATLPIGALHERLPGPYDELLTACGLLEQHFSDMADLEFTVESGKLYMLQARRGKRAAVAAVRIAVDLAEEGLIDRAEAVQAISVKHLARLDRPHIDPRANYRLLTTGLNASPGLATGRVCFDPDEVMVLADEGPVILVRVETSPADVHGMALSTGILTSTGGLVSHAALVARDMGIPAVVGAADLEIDLAERCFRVDGLVVEEGAVITIDGTTGEVVEGDVPSVVPGQSEHVETLLTWADEIAGAPSPDGTPVARLQAAHRALAARDPG